MQAPKGLFPVKFEHIKPRDVFTIYVDSSYDKSWNYAKVRITSIDNSTNVVKAKVISVSEKCESSDVKKYLQDKTLTNWSSYHLFRAEKPEKLRAKKLLGIAEAFRKHESEIFRNS